MSDAYSEYGTTTDVSALTNLHSLAAGNIWRSAQHTQTPGTALPFVNISFKLCVDASAADGEQFIFYWGKGDDAASSEIRDAGSATSEAELSAANDIDDVQDACRLVHVAPIDRASQDVQGVFTVEDPGSDWQLFIELDSSAGALDASGNLVRYRYWQPGDGS